MRLGILLVTVLSGCNRVFRDLLELLLKNPHHVNLSWHVVDLLLAGGNLDAQAALPVVRGHFTCNAIKFQTLNRIIKQAWHLVR